VGEDAEQEASKGKDNGGDAGFPCLHNASAEDVGKHLDAQRFFWLDLEKPSRKDLEALGEKLHLHPLTIEDAEQFGERPKREHFDGYVYIVVYGVDPSAAAGERLLREVHCIVSGEFVVTVHRRPYKALTDLRERRTKEPARSEPYLVFEILETVLATFPPTLDRIDDEIDDIEQSVISTANEDALQHIFALKRDLIAMRRVVTPMRDFFARDADEIMHLPGLEPDSHLYFRDLYDDLVRTSDLIDSYRDLLSGATDMYLSTIANRQGEISKQLTIIATIFLPLSFLTGFFGQNFSFLTNHIINHTWTFFGLGIGTLVASVGLLWVYFRRRGWLRPDIPPPGQTPG
jgi:magnesium transporter